jgi:type I restriction enzyme S subunit
VSNVLPQGWEESIIENISIKVFSGGTPDTRNELFWNGKFNWLSSGETRNKYIIVTEKKITQDGVENSSTKLALPNDILIASAGQGNTRGQTAFCMIETYFNQSLINIRINIKRAYPKYIFYNISSRYNELRQLSDGHSIRGSLTTKIINKLPIKFPSDINEQKRIADILSAFDDKIELNNQMNQTLEDMATTLFKEWFGNFNFPNEQGKTYKDNDGEMKSSVLGEIPIDWNFEEIKKIIDVRDGTHDSPKPQEEGYPLVTSKHIKNNILDLDTPNLISKEDYDKVNKRSKVDTNDILLGMIGTVGDIYLVTNKEIKFAIKNVGLFKTSEEVELYEYIYFWLKTPFIKEHIISRLAGTTQKYISLTELRKLPFLLPPKNIIKSFKNIVNPILKQIQQNQQQNQTLKQQRDTLLPKLMRGEIRV